MKSLLPLFPSTVVGSMPRPQYVKDLLAAGSRTGAHDAGWQRRMNDAVRFSIGMQEQAGIDIVSDGEWRRETYVDVIGEIVNGFSWVKRDVFAYHQVVTQKMTPRKRRCATPSIGSTKLWMASCPPRPPGEGLGVRGLARRWRFTFVAATGAGGAGARPAGMRRFLPMSNGSR